VVVVVVMGTLEWSQFWTIDPPHHQQVEVTWRPPQTHLHYTALYCGIYEYLRAPPANRYRTQALTYLDAIHANNNAHYRDNVRHMQNHRILWIREWLKSLPDDDGECSDAETVVGDDDAF
jgi:hypothetical protein